MSKQKQLPWFRVYATSLGTLKSIDRKSAGEGLIAALEYINKPEDEPTIKASLTSQYALIAYNTLKQGIDDSLKEYAARVEDGKRGAAAKKEKIEQEAIRKYQQEQERKAREGKGG